MLDIKFIRENKDLIKEAARKKHVDFNVDELIETDDRRREFIASIDDMRAKQNKVSGDVSRTEDGSVRNSLIAEMKILKEDLQKKEVQAREIIKKWQSLMLQVPNIPDMSVPEGKSDEDNQEIKKWGEIKEGSFSGKNHIELMQNLDMVDFERGSKVAGFRGYFLKNDGALLSFAVWNFVLEVIVAKGYSPMIVPSIIKKESFMGTGYLPQGEDDLYKTQDDMYLSGTSEVSTMGYFMDEVLKKEDLPKKIISFSPAYRREAGSHGKDTKGLMRVHEFYKLEQIILGEASHEESVKYHEELLANTEEIMQKLKLPYRVVINSGGDLGLGQVKKYDIEAWVPSEGKYRETHSASYFHDFQSRRLNIKYKDKDNKFRFVHSLNNTAIATPRILIAIVENYQQEDGSIKVPEVLQKYMGKDVIK